MYGRATRNLRPTPAPLGTPTSRLWDQAVSLTDALARSIGGPLPAIYNGSNDGAPGVTRGVVRRNVQGLALAGV